MNLGKTLSGATETALDANDITAWQVEVLKLLVQIEKNTRKA
jgi:hypothetical protein